mgnify:CR=1 FL=1
MKYDPRYMMEPKTPEDFAALDKWREDNCMKKGGHVYTSYPANIGCPDKQQHCINCGKIKRSI